MFMKKTIYRILPLALLMGIVYTGCKKYENPPPVFEEFKANVNTQRKVLIISIDGLTGSELKTIAPTNIETLRKTSKYSYDVLRGSVANDAASWATMITGVSYSKHLIKENSFQPTPKENSHEVPAVFRNSFDYVLQYKSVKTAMVTPWTELRNYVKVADFAPVVSTDVAVKDSAVNIINTSASLGTMIVNFRDVQAAGANGGYIATNATYKNAVTKADEYVGNLVTALKARKNYATENWLIIVTTNHGGSNADPKPGFLIASNPDLKEEEVKKRGYNTILFTGKSVLASVPADNGIYDAGDNNNFTVQMQIKMLTASPGYSGFLSKGNGYGSAAPGGVNGWTMGTWAKSWRPYYNGGFLANDAYTLADGLWHTITMTMNRVNATTRTLTIYNDGVPLSTTVNMNGKPMTSSQPLTIGFRGIDANGAVDFYAANVAYFNTVLDAATIKNNIALKDITKHPNYANLTGFWPIDEGGEGVLNNMAPNGYSMLLSGPYTWKGIGNDVPPGAIADPNSSGKSIIITPAAVSATMLYWMNVKILPEFGIDGNPFLNQFEIEFLK